MMMRKFSLPLILVLAMLISSFQVFAKHSSILYLDTAQQLLADEKLKEAVSYLDVHWFQIVISEKEAAQPVVESLFALAQKRQEPHALAFSHLYLGELAKHSGNLDTALVHFSKAERFAQQGDWQALQATTLGTKGNALLAKGEFEASARAYLKSLQLFEAIGRPKKANTLRFNVGSIFFKLEDYARAQQYFTSVLEQAETHKDTNVMVHAHLGVGVVAMKQHRYEAARQHFLEGLALERMTPGENLSSLLINLGCCALETNDLADAKAWLLEGIADEQGTLGVNGEVVGRLRLGQLYSKLSEPDRAEFFLQEALALAQQYGIRNEQVEILSYLADVQEEQGKLEASLASLKASQKLEKEVRGPQVLASVTAMEQNWLLNALQYSGNQRGFSNVLLVLVLLLTVATLAFYLDRHYFRSQLTFLGNSTPLAIPGAIVLTPQLGATPEKSHRKSQPISEPDCNQLWSSLSRLMDEEKLYLNPELTLQELAARLETKRNNLSFVINDRSGVNFRSYLNRFRIDESIFLLQTRADAQLSLEGIGIQAGFKSKSTFYTAFRKVMGCSPLEYLEAVKNQNHSEVA